jgi:hypothetical protein
MIPEGRGPALVSPRPIVYKARNLAIWTFS